MKRADELSPRVRGAPKYETENREAPQNKKGGAWEGTLFALISTVQWEGKKVNGCTTMAD